MGMGKVNAVQRDLIEFFNEWELGFCILLSLFLQILLILAGPLRRIVSRKWLDILLWSAYLLADGTAVFVLGLISTKQFYYSKHHLNAPTNSILHTFWAPFLLAHLGGPDPITAFALEDNELWLRHLFNFLTQCIAVAYVFYQFLTPNKLLAPSLLMFLCGFIKYAERTYALYCASANTFRDSILREPEPEYAKFMRDYISKTHVEFLEGMTMGTVLEPDEALTIMAESEATDLKPLEVVQYAFRYFSHFKGLVVDLIFSFNQRNQSQEFFLKRSCNDAFKIVEVELNFLYDVLFTKLPVVYNQVGFGCRAVSVGAIVTSLVLFHYADKKNFKPQETEITYTLLIGGILLEVIAFFMLVFSDWTVVKLEPSPDENPNEKSWKQMFIDFVVSANVRRGKILCWLLNVGGVRDTGKDSVSKPSDSKWAESISGYNFIHYCLHRRSEAKEKIYDKFGIRAFLDEMVYVKQHPLPCYMKDFIFQELKMKSQKASDLDTAKKICSAKGEYVLEIAGRPNLVHYVMNGDYDEILLVWHIATEICFNVKEDEKIEGEQDHISESEYHRRIAKLISNVKEDEKIEGEQDHVSESEHHIRIAKLISNVKEDEKIEGEQDHVSESEHHRRIAKLISNVKEDEKIEGEQDRVSESEHHRRIAKLISDYMIYLLTMKPGMMSAVSRIGLVRFCDTCDVAKHIFDNNLSTRERLAPEVELLEIACKRLFDFEPPGLGTPKEERGRSILFKALKLAEELGKIQVEERLMLCLVGVNEFGRNGMTF